MKYFCAECQQKHEITEIAADLYDVCIEEVRNNLLKVREYGYTEEFLNRFFRISLFCSNPEVSRKQFLFSRKQIEERLLAPVKSGSSVSGTFELDFQWLLNAYRNSGVAALDTVTATDEEPLLDLDEFPEGAKNCVIFSKEMDFVFSKVSGSLRDLVFSNIGPGRSGGEKAYKGVSFKRACPHCGKNVSQAVGKAPETVIALAGNPRAGKTSCITAIASALYSNRYREYGLSMVANEKDDQWKLLKKEIDRYNEGYIVEKTPVDLNDVPSYSYLLRIGNETERVLTFVDMPGEFWQGGEGLDVAFYQKYAGLYENIDCVWFFISKLAVHAYDLGEEDQQDEEYLTTHEKANLEKQRELREKTADSSETIGGASAEKINSILSGLSTYLKDHKDEEDANRKFEMPPFAIILTKSEVVYDEENVNEVNLMSKYRLFPAKNGKILKTNISGYNNAEIQRALNYNADTGNHYINERRFHERSVLVREYLRRVNRPLCDVIEYNCPKHFYISMAAYGHPAAVPDDSSSGRQAESIIPTQPTPFHEMYPLLWTLAVTEGVYVMHECSWFTPRGWWDVVTNSGNGTVSEGVVEALYHYAKPVVLPRKPDEEELDQAQMWKDISANLLMNGNGLDKREYTLTEFDHPRR